MSQTVCLLDIGVRPAELHVMLTAAQQAALYRFVGRRIAELRQDRFTQEQLADLVGLSRTSIANLEAGRQRVPLHHLAGIADALEVEISRLLPSRRDLGAKLDGDAAEHLEVVGDLTPGARQVLARVLLTSREAER